MTPQDNPISEIEDEKAWKDFGRQGYFIMQGAIDEGASLHEAIHVLTGFYAGMFRGAKEDEEPGG